MRPSSDWKYYGMVMSVRPSRSPSVSHNFPHSSHTCFNILSWKCVCHFLLMNIRSSSSSSVVNSISVNYCRSNAPFGTLNPGNIQFSALFSYMLWHIELKFCICLCYTVLQIKFKCRQFASMFVGVMPLLELRILAIHSFPQFLLHPLTYWAELLHMTLLSCTSDQVCVSFCNSYAPIWNLKYWINTDFPHFSPTCFGT